MNNNRALGPQTPTELRTEAFERRVSAARAQQAQVHPAHMNNGDDEKYADRRASFTKGMKHDSTTGLVERAAYESLLNALKTGVPENFDRIRLSGERKDAAGAFVRRATRVVSCHQQSSGRWQIEATCKGQPFIFSGDFLVEAVGRGVSVIRQSSNRRIYYDRLIGLVKYLRPNANQANFDCRTLVEASERGWWYSAYLPGNCLIVVYLTDADRLSKKDFSLADIWWQLLQQVPHTLARVKLCEYDVNVLSVAANSYQRNEIVGNRWIAIGDASCAFDPLSSQGISKALELSFIAAKAIVNYQSGDEVALKDYASQVGNVFIDYLNQRQTHYSQEKRWSKSISWQRRHENIFHLLDLAM